MKTDILIAFLGIFIGFYIGHILTKTIYTNQENQDYWKKGVKLKVDIDPNMMDSHFSFENFDSWCNEGSRFGYGNKTMIEVKEIVCPCGERK